MNRNNELLAETKKLLSIIDIFKLSSKFDGSKHFKKRVMGSLLLA